MEEQVRLMSGRFLQNRFCDIRWSVVYVVFDFGPAASVETNPVAKFLVPDWGDKVNSDIGLSYRLHWLEGR
jgi:hypothetical protein